MDFIKDRIIIHQFTLGKKERLKSRKKIQLLFESGENFYEFPFKVFFNFSELEQASIQAGFSVSKRRFKRATARNRIKRLMREAWRLNVVPLKNILAKNQLQLNVFLIFTESHLPDYTKVSETIKKVIVRLNGKVEEKLSDKFKSPGTNL